MNNGPCYAIFLMGGAANGKTTALQRYFRIEPSVEGDRAPNDLGEDGKERPVVHQDRRLDPDEFKQNNPMFTMAPDDAKARETLGPGLGGPSGPLTLEEYQRYPQEARDTVEAILRAEFDCDLTQFATMCDPEGRGTKFGGGLTHELSKLQARRYLRMFLAEETPQGSFVWDAVGNYEDYSEWIGAALKAGYMVRIFYVQAPLPVAKMWADRRERKLPEALIISTYERAADAARKIEAFVDDLVQQGRDPKQLSFRLVKTGLDCLEEAEEWLRQLPDHR